MAKVYTDNAAEHILLQNYTKALLNSRKAIELERNNVQAHEQVIASCLHLGFLDQLKEEIDKLGAINSNNDTLQTSKIKWRNLSTLKSEAESYAKDKKFKEAIEKLNQALRIATASAHFMSLISQYENAEENQKEVRL